MDVQNGLRYTHVSLLCVLILNVVDLFYRPRLSRLLFRCRLSQVELNFQFRRRRHVHHDADVHVVRVRQQRSFGQRADQRDDHFAVVRSDCLSLATAPQKKS